MVRHDEDDEETSPLRLDRRQHNNIKDWAVIVTLALNLGGLIWAAAKWSATIDQLQKNQITYDVFKTSSEIKFNSLENRVNLLEYQVNVNKAKLETVK